MTLDDMPQAPPNAPGLDLAAALGRAESCGLSLSESVRPGVEANLALLAMHYQAVCAGLADDGESVS